MKKRQTIAMAFSALALMAAAKEAKLTKQVEQESKKVFIVNSAKKQKEKKVFKEPRPFDGLDNDIVFPSYTQPFFNPTRSMRVKNKLRRKWYK